MHRASALLAALLGLASPAAVPAADADLEVRAELGAGADTNPERTAGAGRPADGFAYALVRAKGGLTGEHYALSATLAEAGRLYFGVPQATAGASRVDATARLSLASQLSAAAAVSANDVTERGHRLDQDVLHGEASLVWDAGEWGASFSGGWSVFAPRDAPLRPFLASGPEAWLRAHWAPVAEHVLSAGYGFWDADYPRWTENASTGRADRTYTVSAEYAYRGSLLAALGYAYSWNRSTAPGGDFERHRLTARGAAFLPHDLTLAARASLQWSYYPEPLFVPQMLLLAEGQENENALEVRLTHPLGEALELALALAFYGGEAGGGHPGLLAKCAVHGNRVAGDLAAAAAGVGSPAPPGRARTPQWSWRG